MLPFVSIIIPTYKDWPRLALCLRNLSIQSYPKESFEIIVVNNFQEDMKPHSLELPENCILIEEGKPGSYAARNAGLQICKGEIVGFTDSDCIPDMYWIENAVNFFQGNDFKRLGGAIHLFFKKARPNNIEKYDQIFAFPQKEYVASGNAVTANMFAYKQIFQDIGGFDEDLLSGGDYQWGKLAQRKGYSIGYAINVVVKHPARSTVKELVTKAKRVGKGQAIFQSRKRNAVEKGFAFLKLLKPRHWEVGYIFKKGQDFSLSSKIFLVFLRHYITASGDFARLVHEKVVKRS